jgi:hypothetical protein
MVFQYISTSCCNSLVAGLLLHPALAFAFMK